MRILLTGATGFIGNHLRKNLRDDYELYCLSRRTAPIVTPKEKWITVDLSKPFQPDDIPPADCILHFAQANSKDPDELLAVNSESTKHLLLYALKNIINLENRPKKFIFASTGSVYDYKNHFSDSFRETDNLVSHNDGHNDVYAFSKKIAENYLSTFDQFFYPPNTIEIVILRIFFPYGPGRTIQRLISRIFESVKDEQALSFNKNYGPFINPIYINDLVQYVRYFIENKQEKPCDIYNVAGSEVYSLKEIADVCAELLGKKYSYQLNDAIALPVIGNIEKIIKNTGIKPSVNLKEGIQKMIDHPSY